MNKKPFDQQIGIGGNQFQTWRQCEERYRIVSELTSDYAYAFFVKSDGALGVEWVTETFYRVTGFTLAEMKDLDDWFQIIHPGDQIIVRRQIETLLVNQTKIIEYRIITKSGEIRWLRAHERPVWDEAEGRVVRIYGAARDITDRKLMEKALAEERNLLRTLINNLPDYIYVKDVESRFLLVNEATKRHLGATTIEDIIGKTDFDFSPPELAKQYYDDEQELFRTGHPLVGHEEPIFDHESGRERWVLTTKSPFHDTQGQMVGLVGLNRDITERKQAEIEKNRLYEAVSRQREQLRALTRQLAETQEAERKQLARELHDRVGQNLTALDLNLNIILNRVAELSIGADDLIQTRLQDSLTLVGQTAERIRDVMVNLRPPVLDDYGLVAALGWYAEQFASRAGCEVVVQGEEPVPRLATPIEDTLFRMVQEALTNVVKHAQASRVVIKVQANAQAVRLMVTDNGCGFDVEQRLESASRRHWGLITMIERAEAVGGHCTIVSQPDQGTQVTVEVNR